MGNINRTCRKSNLQSMDCSRLKAVKVTFRTLEGSVINTQAQLNPCW